MVKMMTKEIGYLIANQNPPGTWAVDSTSTEGWTMPSNGFFVNEQILDLAGLSKQELTIFFNGIAQQDMGNPLVYNQAAGDTIVVYDLISSVPLNTNELGTIALTGNFNNTLGQNTPTFEQTIYLQRNVYTVDLDTAAWGSAIQVSSHQMGSLAATASDRLYCYRIVLPGTPTAANRIDTFPVRFVLGADPREEKEYQYLMRLKRSYDLQQSFDVDGNRPH